MAYDNNEAESIETQWRVGISRIVISGIAPPPSHKCQEKITMMAFEELLQHHISETMCVAHIIEKN